jgi:hypothetical protein
MVQIPDSSSPPLPPKTCFPKFACFGAENTVRVDFAETTSSELQHTRKHNIWFADKTKHDSEADCG